MSVTELTRVRRPAFAETFDLDDFVVGQVGQETEVAHPLVDARPVVVVNYPADFL